MLAKSSSTFIVIALCCVVGMTAGETCSISNTPSVAIVTLFLSREITQDYVLLCMYSILIQLMRPIRHLKTFITCIR